MPGVGEPCAKCHGTIDLPDGRRWHHPDTRAVACFIQQTNPLQWPRTGIHPRYQDFASLYDLLLIRQSDHDNVWTLPCTETVNTFDPTQTVQYAWPCIKSKRAMYVDCVASWQHGTQSLVFCTPVDQDFDTLNIDEVKTPEFPHGAKFFQLRKILRSMRGARSSIRLSPEAMEWIASFDRWLCENHSHPETVLVMWRGSAKSRMTVSRNRLHENHVVAPLCKEPTMVVKNPIFNSGLVLPNNSNFLDEEVQYVDDYETRALQKTEDEDLRQLLPASARPSLGSMPPRVPWGVRFPLHRAAVEGDAEAARDLIRSGQNPAAKDEDSWTPLHYAAWFGRDHVARVLMEDWQGAPMARTDRNATALHFAARNGRLETVRILLACPIVDATATDDQSLSPLQLCERFQQNDWVEVAKILRNPLGVSAVNRFGGVETAADMVEHRICLMDGSVKVLRLPGGDRTSAAKLRDAVAGIISIPEEAWHVFGVWIHSEGLELQLDADMKPLPRLERWRAMEEQYADDPSLADRPELQFRRSCHLTLAEERRVGSQVALKFLYDEAYQNFITSQWPTTVADAIHLGGLLMQIRFGDYSAERHKPGFLRSDLDTFVPNHLLHNQLKTAEWERRIYAAHMEHKGQTDVFLLHRLFLQFVRQWPFYGATFFNGDLSRSVKRVIRATRDPPIRVGINSDWLCIIFTENNSLKLQLSPEEMRYELDEASGIILKISFSVTDTSKLEGLSTFLKGQPDSFHIVSRQARLMFELLNVMGERRRAVEREQERVRMEQGGPRVLKHVSQEVVERETGLDAEQHDAVMKRERLARYHLVHSFGQQLSSEDKCLAQQHFEKFCRTGTTLARVTDLKSICYELGYWLGNEFDGARMILDVGGSGLFSFRDLVSWWTQSNRSWLFLLDDPGFRLRQSATEIFLRNDPQRTGKVENEKFTGLIRGLRNSNLTKKSEAVIKTGLDPSGLEYVLFNDYINWLARMGIINEQIAS
eukprot:m.156694 g.156694  ORF g.156694 m.156694 type:complete len:988 (-) comp16994_c0_seq1:418-3381(-)